MPIRLKEPRTRGRQRGPSRVGRGAVVAVAMLATSCSSSDGAAPTITETSATAVDTTTTSTTTTTTTTTIPPSTTTTTTTTRPAAVVDTVPPSEPLSTVAAEPTDTTPLEIPTDTLFQPDTIEGEVEQAVLGFYASFVRCLEQLPNCDVQQAGQFTALDYAEANRALIEGWNATGSRARNVETFEYEVLSVDEFSEDKNEALVTSCNTTGVDIYIPATDDQPENITFGEPQSTIDKSLVQKIGEIWFVTAIEVVEMVTGEGNTLCK